MPRLSLKLKVSRPKESKAPKQLAQDNQPKSVPNRRASEPAISYAFRSTSESPANLKHRKFSLGRLLGDHRKLESVAEESASTSTCSRSSSCSSGMDGLEQRETRLSELEHLDSYMKHACQSPCDDDLCNLPNRLCCAQLLKVFFWREEKRYVSDLLHGRLTTKPCYGRRQSCPTTDSSKPRRKNGVATFGNIDLCDSFAMSVSLSGTKRCHEEQQASQKVPKSFNGISGESGENVCDDCYKDDVFPSPTGSSDEDLGNSSEDDVCPRKLKPVRKTTPVFPQHYEIY